ncbi:ribonucleotide reductase N-terminal alpha domain-containing protein [Lysobacter koreensis]|uniref:Ribonucleoside-diphosphate reductase n=1 Tax=Lysobacter koreensis TaxID=266122 RepID=A0ABW2YHE7_9GAMM
MVSTTRFTDPAAVDAWDRWFRWRNGDGLRDRTIDATWWRVADALAGVEGGQARTWAQRYVDAFSRWQLLPDERLLRMAGTDSRLHPFDSPGATLNVAAFVLAPLTQRARFDGERFAGIAALAVRLLDDALVAMHGAAATFADLRIGLIGLGDALHLLGLAYEDTGAAEQARAVAKALATGTLQGTAELAAERGPIDDSPRYRVALWRDRGLAPAVIEDALCRGIRHRKLTAIALQPRLALLSNNASDALDPAPPRRGEAVSKPGARSAVDAEARLRAQLGIRAAIQPWIDAPIDYPLALSGEPDPQTIASTSRLAGAYGLSEPTFRCTQGP